MWTDFELENKHPDEIGKYCGVFKTLGDKRLQTHLFQGLVTLLQKSIKEELTQDVSKETTGMVDLFKSIGRFDEKK